MFKRHPNAFSLIELLIVVSILLVLSAIGLMNFQDAQARAKTSRAVADMRTITLGLEAYHADHNDYPSNPAIPEEAENPDEKPWDKLTSFNIIPFKITTPVAYVTSLPRDPFRQGPLNVNDYYQPAYAEEKNYYSYYRIISKQQWLALAQARSPPGGILVSLIAVDAGTNPEEDSFFNRGALIKYGDWVQWSAGPDGYLWQAAKDFVNPGDPLNALKEPRGKPWGYTFDVPYDPTNGTISFGNIIKTQRGGLKPAFDSSEGGGSGGSGGDGGGEPAPSSPAPGSPPQSPGGRPPQRGSPRGSMPSVVDGSGGDSTHPKADPQPTSKGANLHPERKRPPSRANSSTGDATLSARASMPAESQTTIERIVKSRPPARTDRFRPHWSVFFEVSPRSWLLALLILGLVLLILSLIAALRRKGGEEVLLLNSASVNDMSLLGISGIKRFKNIYLAHSDITDKGLRFVRNLEKMESLNLWGTGVTDKGMGYLSDAKGLKSLVLCDTQVTDAGLARLEDMKGLEDLVLSGLPLTDAGAKSLKKMTGLKHLSIRHTGISPGAVLELQTALPSCEILHDFQGGIGENE